MTKTLKVTPKLLAKLVEKQLQEAKLSKHTLIKKQSEKSRFLNELGDNHEVGVNHLENMRELIEARLLAYGGWEKNKNNELYIRWVVDDVMKALQSALEEGYEKLRVDYDLDQDDLID